mmetsp:Transcript_4529/g.13730  ORF Transcript_4529/g.13730 Transcript_4529/m.13730 type:complete len:118 (-) Transcript_4529:992-1345(-)
MVQKLHSLQSASLSTLNVPSWIGRVGAPIWGLNMADTHAPEAVCSDRSPWFMMLLVQAGLLVASDGSLIQKDPENRSGNSRPVQERQSLVEDQHGPNGDDDTLESVGDGVGDGGDLV